MTNSASIRVFKAGIEHLTQAKELINLWQLEDRVTTLDFPADNYLEKLLLSSSFHQYLALDDDKVIGGLTAYELPMFSKQESEMFLYEIGVEASYRKLGVATNLINALKKTCSEKAIHIIFVGTEADNTPAQKLYEASGAIEEDIAWFTYEV